jgi:O-antigen ligase
VGRGGFRVEWLRERSIDEVVVDAHSLYLETAAELGLVGLAALALLIAGLAAAVRRLYRSDAALAVGPAAVLAAYALHAGVDWDWEMPALTLPVLVIGGMALSRVALSEPRAG